MKNKIKFALQTRSLSAFILASAVMLSQVQIQAQDTALNFDGDDFVSIPDMPAFHQIEAADSITIEAWVMMNGFPQGWFPIVDKYRTTGFGWMFQIFGGSSPNMQFVGGSGPTASVAITPQLGVWTHVAVAYRRSEGIIRFYINGTLIGSPSYNADIQTTDSGAFFIGFGPSGVDEYALGRIDEVRLWNRALPPSEIAANYLTRLSGSESGLVGYWRFDEGAGLSVSDSSASGLNGALGNSPQTPTWVTPGASASAKIFWYGDQATCDLTYAPNQGSFHSGNNWLNFNPPGTAYLAAFYAELPTPLQSNGTIGAAPYNIRFGDFNDVRPFGSCNDTFIQGGPTSVGSVVVGSGDDWEFYFNSNSPGAPSNSAPLTVLGNTTIAYDPHPNPPLLTLPYSINSSPNPKLHIHSGTMNSGFVTIGGVGPGELKIASDAVLSSPFVTVAQGGVLSGKGRVIGTVDCIGGKIAPGNSVGSLTIQGNFSLSTNSEVNLEVGGLVPGVSYDQLVITGSANFAGTVRISFVNGFAPLAGDSFDFFGPSGFNASGATFVSDTGVQIAETNVQGNQLLAVVAIPTPSADYQQWRQSKFGTISSRDGEPRANPDGDESDNFTEFVFNMDPTISDYHSLEPGSGSSGFPVASIVLVGAEKQLAFDFIRHKRIGTYSVQTSAALPTWTTEANPVIDSIVSVSTDYERVRSLWPLLVNVANTNSTQRFFRIAVPR